MSAWTRWRTRRAEDLRNRIQSAAAEDNAEDADIARLRLLAVAQLSDIPPGTNLYLRAEEWQDADRTLGTIYRDVKVDQFHDRVEIVDGVTWVAVTGHDLDCLWTDAAPHPPCLALIVRVDAILRAVRA